MAFFGSAITTLSKLVVAIGAGLGVWGVVNLLEGGIFGLFTREDIVSQTTGKVLIEKNTIIELRSTDKNGEINFTANLPVDGTYYVKEMYFQNQRNCRERSITPSKN